MQGPRDLNLFHPPCVMVGPGPNDLLSPSQGGSEHASRRVTQDEVLRGSLLLAGLVLPLSILRT